jgi:hypothetical protein
MNYIPHLTLKNGVKFQENRVHSPQTLGILKPREEMLVSRKKHLMF